jgi:hypothetical protein
MNKVTLNIKAKTLIDMNEQDCHGAEFKMNVTASEPINEEKTEAIIVTLLCQLLSEMTNLDVVSALKMQRDIDNLIENPN